MMRSDPRTSLFYTGLTGRLMCFQFETDERLTQFEQSLRAMLQPGTYTMNVTRPAVEVLPEPVVTPEVVVEPPKKLFAKLPLKTSVGMLVKVHINDKPGYQEFTYGIVADPTGEKPKLLYQSLSGLPTLQFDRILDLEDVEFPEGFLTHRKVREARMLSETKVNQIPLKRKMSRYEGGCRIRKEAELYKSTFEKRIA